MNRESWDELERLLDVYEAKLGSPRGPGSDSAATLETVRDLQRISDAADLALLEHGGWKAFGAGHHRRGPGGRGPADGLSPRGRRAIARALQHVGALCLGVQLNDSRCHDRPIRHAMHQTITNEFVRWLRSRVEAEIQAEPVVMPGSEVWDA